jgi:hypothetical protein
MKKILTSFLLLTSLFLTACQGPSNSGNYRGQQEDGAGTGAGDDVIDRHPDHFIYTKHARCRMGCRHIDETEVREILEKGRINYRKSEPAGRPDPKYALEGTTHDGQKVRIIFAPAKRGMVVITVIDLGTEWSCDCK